MLLRFCNVDQAIKCESITNRTKEDLVKNACDWCGFQTCYGNQRYQEFDGTSRVACTICFNAQHVLSADLKLFDLIWLEEIDQIELSYLTRTIAVTLKILQEDKENTGSYLSAEVKEFQKIYSKASDIFKSLKKRATDTNDKFIKIYHQPLIKCWNKLDPEVQESLHGGLRLLPLGFADYEINFWLTKSGSFEDYNSKDALKVENWFKRLYDPVEDKKVQEDKTEKVEKEEIDQTQQTDDQDQQKINNQNSDSAEKSKLKVINDLKDQNLFNKNNLLKTIAKNLKIDWFKTKSND